MNQAHPVADTLAQILSAVDAPFESIRMTLDNHPLNTLGDPDVEGTAAWHLVHTAETFRLHAHHLTKGHADSWPTIPDDVAGSISTLRSDVQRLTAWAREHLDANATIDYGGERTVSDMLGVMLRHIVWHAAAAHYWCRWRSPRLTTPDADSNEPQ